MRLQASRIAAFVLSTAVLIAGCGGGSPTAPPRPLAAPQAPTPTPLPPPVALDGLLHDVVAADISPPAPALRAPLSVSAPGYLPREQPHDGGPVYLWKVEEDYVNSLVYPLTFTDASFRMIRWEGGFTVTLEQGLDENDTVMRKTEAVVAEVARHTGLPIRMGPGGAVRVSIDPRILSDDSAVGIAIRTYRGATIVGGIIKFASVADLLGTSSADYTNVYLHEMGHVMGLGHSPLAREIMTPGGGARITLGEFQPREALALHMMYQHRRAGNRPPDRDGELFAQSAARPVVSVIHD